LGSPMPRSLTRPRVLFSSRMRVFLLHRVAVGAQDRVLPHRVNSLFGQQRSGAESEGEGRASGAEAAPAYFPSQTKMSVDIQLQLAQFERQSKMQIQKAEIAQREYVARLEERVRQEMASVRTQGEALASHVRKVDGEIQSFRGDQAIMVKRLQNSEQTSHESTQVLLAAINNLAKEVSSSSASHTTAEREEQRDAKRRTTVTGAAAGRGDIEMTSPAVEEPAPVDSGSDGWGAVRGGRKGRTSPYGAASSQSSGVTTPLGMSTPPSATGTGYPPVPVEMVPLGRVASMTAAFEGGPAIAVGADKKTPDWGDEVEASLEDALAGTSNPLPAVPLFNVAEAVVPRQEREIAEFHNLVNSGLPIEEALEAVAAETAKEQGGAAPL
jgi:hypothetical protein